MGLCWGDKKRGRILQARNQGRKAKAKEQKVSSPALQSEDNLPKEEILLLLILLSSARRSLHFLLCARAFFFLVSLAEVAVLDSVKSRLHCGRCECVGRF